MSDNKFGITISGNEDLKSAVPYILNQFKKLSIPISFIVTTNVFFDKKITHNIDFNNIFICINDKNLQTEFIPLNSYLLKKRKFIKNCNSHHNIKEMSLLLGLNKLDCNKSLSIVLDNNKSAPFETWCRQNSHIAHFRIILSNNKNISLQIKKYFDLYKTQLYDFFYFSYN